jgi:polyisoprenoid-binding protein YceI
MPTFGPDMATCEVFTFREGLLSAAAHDLVLRVEAFAIEVDPAAVSVKATFDAGSLRVVSALRDGRPLPGALSAADVRDIERAIREKVLLAARYPEIRFTSTGAAPQPGGYELRGALALAGRSRPLVVAVREAAGRLEAEVPLHQPDFGIRPYSAMLGAIRVKPDVRVRISVPALVSAPRG